MVRIKDMVASTTRQNGRNYLIVKVETDAPKFYGVGCAALNSGGKEHISAFSAAVRPMLVGRDLEETKEPGRLVECSGTVLPTVLGAVDLALWNLRAKLEGKDAVELLERRRTF